MLYFYFHFQLAKLPLEDMNAVNNMRLLAPSSDAKKSSAGAFSLKFDMHKVNVLLFETLFMVVNLVLLIANKYGFFFFFLYSFAHELPEEACS